MISQINNILNDFEVSKDSSDEYQERLSNKLEYSDKAIQWNGNNICEIILFTGDNINYTWKNWSGKLHVANMTVSTPEGKRKVPVENYIVKTSDGSFRTYKPKKFYQLVNAIDN